MPGLPGTAGVALLLVFAFACRGGATALPGWDESSTPPTASEGDETQRDNVLEEPGEGDEAASADPDAEVQPMASSDPEDEAQPPMDEAAGSKDPKPKPLPKPLHPKLNSACGKDSGIGQRLKPFKLKTPDGKTVSPNSYRGRVLLVNFWGTWCKPCLEELPEFDQLYRRYRAHGLTLVAIATDEDPEAVRDFIQRRRLAARVVIGGESYANQYASDRFPFTFIVDPSGLIKASYRGYKPECAGQLESDLRAELERRNR